MANVVTFPSAPMRAALKATVETTMIDSCVIVELQDQVVDGEIISDVPVTVYTGKCRVHGPSAGQVAQVADKVITVTPTYVIIPTLLTIKPGSTITVTSSERGDVIVYRVEDMPLSSQMYERRIRVTKEA